MCLFRGENRKTSSWGGQAHKPGLSCHSDSQSIQPTLTCPCRQVVIPTGTSYSCQNPQTQLVPPYGRALMTVCQYRCPQQALQRHPSSQCCLLLLRKQRLRGGPPDLMRGGEGELNGARFLKTIATHSPAIHLVERKSTIEICRFQEGVKCSFKQIRFIGNWSLFHFSPPVLHIEATLLPKLTPFSQCCSDSSLCVTNCLLPAGTHCASLHITFLHFSVHLSLLHRHDGSGGF